MIFKNVYIDSPKPAEFSQIIGFCYMCRVKKQHTLQVPMERMKEAIKKYNEGALIQVAFPFIPSEVREFMISNTCSTCWNKMFPEENS